MNPSSCCCWRKYGTHLSKAPYPPHSVTKHSKTKKPFWGGSFFGPASAAHSHPTHSRELSAGKRHIKPADIIYWCSYSKMHGDKCIISYINVWGCSLVAWCLAVCHSEETRYFSLQKAYFHVNLITLTWSVYSLKLISTKMFGTFTKVLLKMQKRCRYFKKSNTGLSAQTSILPVWLGSFLMSTSAAAQISSLC